MREKINRMMLTALRGQQWKDVRSVVSPAFTTGKIKRVSCFQVTLLTISINQEPNLDVNHYHPIHAITYRNAGSCDQS